MPNLIDDGYEIVPMCQEARRLLHGAIRLLEEFLGGDLRGYHERFPEDQDLRQAQAAHIVERLGDALILEHLDLFTGLIGPDLSITSKPFFRLSRPGVGADNLGFHRDTWYGDSAHEINVWIPLTDVDDGNCLQLVPGSHLWSDIDHPCEQYQRPDVPKGSLKHSLGFLYAPKRLKETVPMTPIPMMVGEMLIFSLALYHGQEINKSRYTRMSLDSRLVNSYAPFLRARSRNANYYKPLSESPVSVIARKYREANGAESSS